MDNFRENNESTQSDTSHNHEHGENSEIFSNINQLLTTNDSAVSLFFKYPILIELKQRYDDFRHRQQLCPLILLRFWTFALLSQSHEVPLEKSF
jgi:hypothetical protein